jgi:hypothetical protein
MLSLVTGNCKPPSVSPNPFSPPPSKSLETGLGDKAGDGFLQPSPCSSNQLELGADGAGWSERRWRPVAFPGSRFDFRGERERAAFWKGLPLSGAARCGVSGVVFRSLIRSFVVILVVVLLVVILAHRLSFFRRTPLHLLESPLFRRRRRPLELIGIAKQ